MSRDETRSVAEHFSRAERVSDFHDTAGSMNEARRDLVRRRVLANVARGSRILEIGCGAGTLTAELAAAGMRCSAIDISPAMVRSARKLAGNSVEVTEADVFTYAAPTKFAAVIANGVAPYYRDQSRFLRRLGEFIEPGGLVAVTHRNVLFNLFALNRGTIDFVVDHLLAEYSPTARAALSAGLVAIPGLAEERRRSSSDELYRGSENPLTVAALYEGCGLRIREIRYCFLHAAPPRLPPIPGSPTGAELQHRYENRWEGMFLGSQFLVIADRR